MMRKFLVLVCLMALTGCAAKPPPPPPAPPPALPPRPAPPPPPKIEAPNFNAMSQQALRARLGAPAFLRKDGPTEMWRYDAGACHAYFFFTVSQAGTQVSHIETIPAGAGETADPACLNALRKIS